MTAVVVPAEEAGHSAPQPTITFEALRLAPSPCVVAEALATISTTTDGTPAARYAVQLCTIEPPGGHARGVRRGFRGVAVTECRLRPLDDAPPPDHDLTLRVGDALSDAAIQAARP